MQRDDEVCYRALATRDARFDGRFFTGVTSTGVYCRPVCPARTPHRKNCRFFACAAAAEQAGFRACRRCRPEAAPGTPAWLGTSATVGRALRMIDDGALDEGGVEALAARLGVGDRHLRRLFEAHLGASPLAVAQTRRAHLARQLIETTTLRMTDVAMAAGFGHVRRFNRAIQASFRASPSALRRSARAPAGGTQVELRLSYRAPLDWAGLLDVLRPRAIPGVERVEGEVYRRTAALGDFAGVIEVRRDPKRPQLVLTAPVEAARALAGLADRARTLFDLGADPAAIMRALSVDPALAPLTERWPGTRVPGAWDRFEVAVRAVLGQQVSVKGATTLAGRLVSRFGDPLPVAARAEGLSHRFPAPEDLAEAPLEEIGLPRARAETVRGLARAIEGGEPILALSESLEAATARLVTLRGVGDWTAQYIAMRTLHEPDAFPSGDLVLRKALGTDGPATAREVRARAEGWRPWRAYAAMLLWRSQSEEG